MRRPSLAEPRGLAFRSSWGCWPPSVPADGVHRYLPLLHLLLRKEEGEKIQKGIVEASLCTYFVFLEDVLGLGRRAFIHSLIRSRSSLSPLETELVPGACLITSAGMPGKLMRYREKRAADAILLSRTKQLVMFLIKSKTREEEYKQLAHRTPRFIPLVPGLLSRASRTWVGACPRQWVLLQPSSSTRPRTPEVSGKSPLDS